LRLKLMHALLAFGPFGTFFITLTDSLGVPLPAAIDVLILTIAIKEPQRTYFAAFLAVLGSTLGNVVLFLAARHGSRWLMRSEPSGRTQEFHRWFQRYGLLTIFVPAVTPVVPFPLKVFVATAGALRTNFGKFLVVVLIARIIRYFGEAYLGLHMGEHAEEFLERNALALLGGVLAVALALYLLLRFNERRGESVP
jgi:membrane protein YqaA with SNARE-associated domain